MRNLLKNQLKIVALQNGKLRKSLSAIKATYREMIADIETTVASMYAKYSAGGIVSYGDMSKFNRLNKLLRSCGEMISPKIKGVIGKINNLLHGQYVTSYYGNAWAVSQATGVALKWRALTDKIIGRGIDSPFFNLAKEKLSTSVKLKLNTLLKESIARGETIRQLNKKIRSVISKKYYEAERIARTETHRVREAAHNMEYMDSKDLGVKTHMMLVATIDSRTREQSAAMDGQRSNDDGKFEYPDGNYYYPGATGHPEWDVNDRERSVQVIDEFEPQFRRVRGAGIVPYQTYNEWIKNQHPLG